MAGWRSFPGLLAYARASGLVSASASFITGLGLEDVELWLISPSLAVDDNAARAETQVKGIKLVQGPLNQNVLTVRASLLTPICTNAYSGATALEDRWQGWVFSLYVRGLLVFDGPIVGWKIGWAGSKAPGATYEDPGSEVTLTAINWLSAGARRRKIETSTGGKFSNTDTLNRTFCKLVRENMVAGSVITPTDWQTDSETRDDFGPVSYACAEPSGLGATYTFKQDPGTNLLDALVELCNTASTDEDWLWPAESRSGSTVTISVLRGRSGGGRQIGSDRSTTASGMVGGGPISAERGNLIGYEEEGDRASKENHYTGLGKGSGAGQRRRYVADTDDIDTHGIYEGIGLIPSGDSDEDIDNEIQRLLNERKSGTVVRKYRLIEMDGFQWPTDWGIKDTLPIYTPMGETRTETVIGVTWTLEGKGPARIEADLGQWPPLTERDLMRSAGGGRGGRGGGGRSRSKRGESEHDPDSYMFFKTVQTDEDAIEADAIDDVATIKGSTSNTPSHIKTDGDDATDTIGIYLEFQDPEDVTENEVATKRVPVLVEGGGTTYYIRLHEEASP